jgi:pyruvate-ferredoxin/flavodoxin oxidoreductase
VVRCGCTARSHECVRRRAAGERARLAVLDRTKEPGAPAEPLCLDVMAAIRRAEQAGAAPWTTSPRIVGGRYGLSARSSRRRWRWRCSRNWRGTNAAAGVHGRHPGRRDHLSLPWDRTSSCRARAAREAVFFGLGADGTVGANKNSIKILGEATASTRRATSSTTARSPGRSPSRTCASAAAVRGAVPDPARRLRRLPPVRLPRPLRRARARRTGGHLLLAAPFPPERLGRAAARGAGAHPRAAAARAHDRRRGGGARAGVGGRINTIMQVCFFALAGVLPRDEAVARIKESIQKSYDKKGDEIVRRNFAAVDQALQHLHAVPLPAAPTATRRRPPTVPASRARLRAARHRRDARRQGDELPCSAFPPDGTWPTDTARWEKRAIATAVPVWDAAICIQCNKCTLMCPHAAIRAKVYDAGHDVGGRPTSRRHRGAARSSAMPPTRSRWRPTTAPAAACACRSVRRATRATRATRRST